VGTTDRRFRAVAAVALLAIAGCGAPGSTAASSPLVTCTNVPAAKCDEAVASAVRSLPNTAAVSIEVVCVAVTCTPESGAMDTVVALADGSLLRSSTLSWLEPDAGGGTATTPVPAPGDAPVLPGAPAMEPTCLGVPRTMCLTMAETSFGELSTEAVIAIVVRCSKLPCTDEHGAGETVVTYADGSTASSGWEYAGQ
jgi:hypothetical protein